MSPVVTQRIDRCPIPSIALPKTRAMGVYCRYRRASRIASRELTGLAKLGKPWRCAEGRLLASWPSSILQSWGPRQAVACARAPPHLECLEGLPFSPSLLCDGRGRATTSSASRRGCCKGFRLCSLVSVIHLILTPVTLYCSKTNCRSLLLLRRQNPTPPDSSSAPNKLDNVLVKPRQQDLARHRSSSSSIMSDILPPPYPQEPQFRPRDPLARPGPIPDARLEGLMQEHIPSLVIRDSSSSSSNDSPSTVTSCGPKDTTGTFGLH